MEAHMALQRVTARLTELRCLQQSEGSGGSEPYLWTTYFAFGAEPLPFQSGPLGIITPAYDAFRAEFPNGMKAGQATPVPSFIASASFDMDLDITAIPRMVGCIAVLMEEDATPQSSIVLGRMAYSKEIQNQLNAFATKRIQSGNFGPITDGEIRAIRSGVESKVKSAVSSNQFLWGAFRDQDDTLGFTYKVFKHPHEATTPDIPDIVFQYFDLPEIKKGSDRFVLSGGLSLGAIPTESFDMCALERNALKAKQDEIKGLQGREKLLQAELHHATPAQKAAIVAEINETKSQIGYAESQLPELQAALDHCVSRPGHSDVGGTHPVRDTH
jgi:hypothetical protein